MALSFYDGLPENIVTRMLLHSGRMALLVLYVFE